MKKSLCVLASLLVAASVVAGCGGGDKKEAAKPAAKEAAKTVVLKVGATPVPHAEILNLINLARDQILADFNLAQLNNAI